MTVRTVPCKSCGALMVWMLSTNGKPTPADADSVDEAELEWTHDQNYRRVPVFDPKAHTAHFVTCPDAEKHRRGR